MVQWERRRGETRADPERLLSLLSMAIRVEPGLLRQIRRLPGAGNYDAAAEIAFWQHADLTSQSSVAATIDSGKANDRRHQYWRVEKETSAETRALMQQILTLASRWRPRELLDVWFEEILSLPKEIVSLLPDPGDRARAISRFTQLGQLVEGFEDSERSRTLAANLIDLFDRMPSEAIAAKDLKPAIDRLYMFLKRMGRESDLRSPVIIHPRNIPARPDAVRHRLALHHQGEHLAITPPDRVAAGGSPLTDITSLNGIISISSIVPSWASDWGYDEFGAWASFTIAGVTQRLRWIEPGRFQMGSPADEPGRYENEGPVHEVTISQGFWLFETPCTQALWRAVMGENPSRFQFPDRPVEDVSWGGVQGFMARINGLVPGLSLTLPTEAQWEYACRAGTQTARYTGPIDIEEDDEAPALDSVAWYDGNSGGETHPVGLKAPNAWGLYDMLGNVWEWCADGRRDYGSVPETDPIGATEFAAERSLRGGSWFDTARFVRAAYRDWAPPDGWNALIGFRCAQGQGGAEGSLPPQPRQAERRGAAARTAQRPGATLVEVGAALARVPLPAAPALIIRSDCEELHLNQISRPDWASAIGRDRFGLWTRIEIEGATQHLRWIAPGRFSMGSPEDEPGRRDHEGPVHEVTIGRGFWLFDTPCTQALWQAVMGRSPNRFQPPDRPVVTVSWDDVQIFSGRINALVPGLSLTLPTEAQWEYACRAGTQTARYTGPIDIEEDDEASALASVAWYDGNSGGETHPVGQKAPNGWGLYDMLGNVWEWCADGQRAYGTDPLVDPIGATEAGAMRSLRGGSWFNTARNVRAAFRYWNLPDVRDDNIGFRCAQGQGGAEGSLSPQPRLAERRGAATRAVQRPAGTRPGSRQRKN